MPSRHLGVRAASALALAAVAVTVAAGPFDAGSASAAAAACNKDTVQYTAETPAALTTLQSAAAWPIATGKGIVVAVVDSGVDAANAHLTGVVLPGIDLVGDGEAADGRSDLAGHGTAIAGEIAAQPVPGSGVQGLAPGAKILPVRVFRGDDDQSVKDGFGPDTAKLAAGIRYAADRGASIINVSLSETADDPQLQDAVSYAFGKGSLVVASAGNRMTADDPSDGLRYPAAYPEALGVTAVNADGLVDDSSIHGPQVAVSAPGSNVLTASFAAGDCLYSSDAASSSFATGYASAAAALVAQAHPADGPAGWRYRLMATASRADPDSRDDLNGWGLIQPYDALTFVADGSVRGPKNPLATAIPQPVPSVAPLTLGATESPLALTQNAALWAGALGATVLVVVALLGRRLRKPRSPRS